MAWDRNDWIALILIIVLIVIGILIAAVLLGWMPQINNFFRFQEPKPTSILIKSWLI